jgi:3-dehydroquinate dehydratase-2
MIVSKRTISAYLQVSNHRSLCIANRAGMPVIGSNRSKRRGGKVARNAPAELRASKADVVQLHIINGPNLNLLGEREPEIYGRETLADVERSCRALCEAGGARLEFRQTNHEGILIDWIQEARASAGIIINPGGCSYSVSVLDALKACTAPIIEVHVSNIHARSATWRADSKTAAAAIGIISGFGVAGYSLALEFLLNRNRSD